MINTSCHDEFKSTLFRTFAISGNRGKDALYDGKCYPELAPKLSFWKVWHDNIGKISEEENNRYYVEQYWKEVLSKLDVEKVYKDLNYSVLLCYEPNTEFCHRHIVAAWFELLLGARVTEINYHFVELEKPTYIKEYLEDVMKANIDMHGFKSLRAAYLYEKSEKLEGQAAAYMRSEADMIEKKYREEHKSSVMKKVLDIANKKII